MDEVAKLREALAKEQRRREEAESRASDAQRRREEEQRRREEEQCRREKAEQVARTSQPQTLGCYLEACHSLSLAMKMNYVRSLLSPISSEHGLRSFERDTVENAVQKLISAVYNNPLLRNSLGLQGAVTFESHTNLGTTDDNLSKSLENMSLPEDSAGDTALAPTAAIRKPRRPAKGKGNRADQFCIYRTSDGANVPTTAIEYKAPHKLSQDEVVTGLSSEVWPARDVINKEGEGFVFASKALAAAVITQLFSYMISKGIQYGYVSTGQTFIFLYIPDDPTVVFYSVCVPNLDVLEDDENRLHRTAVAQVFAFILRAIRARPPPQSWHEAAERLDTWGVEFEDVLSKIPATVRKAKERASPYKPQRWRGFTRSPIRTRSRCQQPNIQSPYDDNDDDGNDAPPSPSPGQLTRSGGKLANAISGRKDATSSSGSAKGGGGGGEKRQDIKDRPYCTHRCLLGLAFGRRRVDESCPNAPYHARSHMRRADFLRLLRMQLATDRGPDADSVPLYVKGAVGSLFKVRLSASGYTLVAKGVQSEHHDRLRHEETVYNRLADIQGKRVPVCVGLIDLDLPFYCDGGVFNHVLLLSWAGQPLSRCIDQVNKVTAMDAITMAYTEIHRLGVRHDDAELRNVMYDGNFMVIDFERAKLCSNERAKVSRQPLGPVSPNGQSRKRKWEALQKQGRDPFAEELHSVLESIRGCVARREVTHALFCAPARTK
ncbi:hypothetical protein Daus18300_014487 [Diaporthe australafricana]|uniref:Protein kinase domain-containing protein n=1 Tax=Diaporthe australafricana TaxID=127596 RepID=A0ABR3VUZ5_9PEZI